MKLITVLLDSLNRHALTTYNKETWVKTPNIDRLSHESIVFDNHWIGSAPCMPARRDFFTGRMNFLERCWGPIEPFDITLQEVLRRNDIFCHVTTDHTHYVEPGGENYIQSFNTWEMHRGQEYDPWVSRVTPPSLPDEYYGQASKQYELNRAMFKTEADYPTPKTFASACQWLKDNKDEDDYYLHVEGFDPHEPFDCPDEYLDLYDDDYCGLRYEWSGYAPVKEPQAATEHLRKRYAGTLTMTDRWVGKLIETLKDTGLWEDTLLIFTTDHGHLLGEHNWVGKNIMHFYNELSHIPLMIHMPGHKMAGKRVNAITQTIDIMPTILDFFNIEIPDSVQGKSLRGLIEGKDMKIRDDALFGMHGKAVNIFDGRYTYFRGPANENNEPCFNYCAMPITSWRFIGKNCMEKIEVGRFLDYTDYPVFKIPSNEYSKEQRKDLDWNPMDISHIIGCLLFDNKEDYKQQKPIKDLDLESIMIDKLIAAMEEFKAPKEQYERLGLKIN
ncbi:MAG: sulfatase [Clostridia bacterium]|jgi:arylsulfatase A-like enzyme|nr:sulfatase [Clostridia bacterium]